MMPAAFLLNNPHPDVNLNVLQLAALDPAAAMNIWEFQKAHPNGKFWWSTIFAICSVESHFKPVSFRREPSGVTSYGIMQVLDVTAGDNVSDPREMYRLDVGIREGLRYLSSGYEILRKNMDFGYDELFAGYNEGYGNVLKGRPDPAYVKLAEAAQEHFKPLDEVQQAWNNSQDGLTMERTTILSWSFS